MKEDPLPSLKKPGKSEKIQVFFKGFFWGRFKFAKNILSKLFLFLKNLFLIILRFPQKFWKFIRKINLRSLQNNSNRITDQFFTFKYFQHFGILVVFVLVLISNVLAENTDQLGNIETSFTSEASAKSLNDADLVEIVKTVDKYTLVNEDPEILPKNLDKDRKIVFDQKGFIVKPVLAMTAAENSGAPVQNSAAEPTSRNENLAYTVQNGDTLGGISETYDLKITTLKFANNLSDIDTILPGQKLTIPFTDGMIHTVKAGETLSGVVKIYQGDFAKTLTENNLDANGTIYIGQKVLIVDGKYIPPKPAPSLSNKRFASTRSEDYNGPKGNFRFPTSGGTYYNGYHWWAIDIPRSIGTAVYASDGGRVVTAGWNSGGYGRYIVINHGNSYSTLYAHLSSIGVNAGDYVNQGQFIGGIGSTGRSTGPHLHFEIILNGRKLNPIKFF